MRHIAHAPASEDATANLNLNDETLMTNGAGQRPDPSSPKGYDATETLGVLAVMASETEQSREATGGVAAAEMGAGWLAPQYLVSLYKELASLPDGPERFALLQKASGNVVSMQLAGVWAGRLRVEQEKLAFLHQKHKDLLELAKAIAAAKAEAAKVATTKKRDLQEPMTEEELKACVDKVDEIFGLKGAKIIPTHAVGASVPDGSPGMTHF